MVHFFGPGWLVREVDKHPVVTWMGQFMSNQGDRCEGLLTPNGVSDVDAKTVRQSQAMWFLAGRLSSDGPWRYIPIDTKPFCVGRKSDSSLCLCSKRVSSVHAELFETGSSLVLHDLGSTNGTFVNGKRLGEPASLSPADLIQFADVPFRVMRQSMRDISVTAHDNVVDQAIVLVLFDKLMSEKAVVPYYQPIVDLSDDGVVGFEALARSNISELRTPDAMFSAAAQLGLEVELSQMMRFKAVQETSSFQNPPHLFLNTHPAELGKPGLIASMRSVRALNATQEITLEIHEKAITNCSDMRELHEQLEELNVGLAFDDFGVGQSRIVELFDVHPKYLKFDMSLIRDIHAAPIERHRLVASLVKMSHDVGATPLAEGIECEAERDACVQLGFELAQGFYFGHPVPLIEPSREAPSSFESVPTFSRHTDVSDATSRHGLLPPKRE